MLWDELEFAEITASRHMAMEVAYAIMKTRDHLVNFSVDIWDANTVVIHLDDNNYVTCAWKDHKYTAIHSHFPNEDDCEPVNKVIIEAPHMPPVIDKVAAMVIEHGSSIESIIRRAIKK